MNKHNNKEQVPLYLFKLSEIGGGCWYFIHYFSYKKEYKIVNLLFHILRKYFLCAKCRRHISQYYYDHLQLFPLSFHETVAFQNSVNKRINKPSLTHSQVIQFITREYNYKIKPIGYFYIVLLIYYHTSKEVCLDIVSKLNTDYVKMTVCKLLEESIDFHDFLGLICNPYKNILANGILNGDNKGLIVKELATTDYKPF